MTKKNISKKILILEDDFVSRKIVREWLISADYNVEEARDGAEAIVMMNTEIYDLIIVDSDLPVVTGGEFINLLKEDKETNKIPIVVFSSTADEKEIIKLRDMGVDEFMLKSSPSKLIINSIQVILNDHPGNRVLLIDDDKLSRTLIGDSLNKEGFKVLKAENGNKGFELLGVMPVDIILLDLTMPVMDGYEFLENIKAYKEYKDIPVIVFTSANRAEEVNKISELPIADYIVKSSDREILVNKINEMILKK